MKALAQFGRQVSDETIGPERQFLEAYRKLLFGQYHSMSKTGESPNVEKEAEDIVKLGEQATWEDLYRLEAALIQLEPSVSLVRRAWNIRNEFKAMSSPDEFKDYIESNPPKAELNADPEALSALRADLLLLQREINWQYLVVWAFEAFRAHLTKWIVRQALLFYVALFAISRYASEAICLEYNLNIRVFVLIIGAGVLGGITSTLRRVQTASHRGNADLSLTRLDQSNASIYVSPLLGGVFALLLFFLFAGGLLEGGFFPKVTLDFISCDFVGDVNNADLAKLLVWSFIAGFAEKFVPDRLQTLTEAATAPKSAPKPPTQPAA